MLLFFFLFFNFFFNFYFFHFFKNHVCSLTGNVQKSTAEETSSNFPAVYRKIGCEVTPSCSSVLSSLWKTVWEISKFSPHPSLISHSLQRSQGNTPPPSQHTYTHPHTHPGVSSVTHGVFSKTHTGHTECKNHMWQTPPLSVCVYVFSSITMISSDHSDSLVTNQTQIPKRINHSPYCYTEKYPDEKTDVLNLGSNTLAHI